MYLLFLSILLDFNWVRFFQPLPMISVLAGMLILTATQYKQGTDWRLMAEQSRWNGFNAGLLTTLLSLLSQLTAGTQHPLNSQSTAESLIPVIYGGILHLLLGVVADTSPEHSEPPSPDIPSIQSGLFLPATAGPILAVQGFSVRETHVALKLLEGSTNKEIAEQLYISEATVKKHIQNMFRKCGAEDRQDFIRLYMVWAQVHNSPTPSGTPRD